MDRISKPALENVLNNEIKLIPEKYINTYKHWMENVHDWCISRQLWWGQQIPAWYDNKSNTVVCKTKEEAFKLLKEKNPAVTLADIKQDEDVLDTWFSSWLWPISVFDGFKNPNGKDIQYYYPTNDLVTAPEILFFWVARMIIAGYEYKGAKPFSNVYLTGIVRDKQGRKMSKSLGNSPDPIELIDKYGADGVRVGMLLCSPAGNDLPFDEGLCEQGRNFSNKIWNAFRLIKGWEVDNKQNQSANNAIAIEWFESKFNEQLNIINDLYSKYRISEALMATYKLIWDDFCAWYLEMIKPEFVDGTSLPIDKKTYDATIVFFENILKVLHPFMPFISEEIWHLIAERKEKDCIIVSSWPTTKAEDTALVKDFEVIIELITAVRNIRKQKNISPKEKLELYEKTDSASTTKKFSGLVTKLCNLSAYDYTTTKKDGTYSFVLKQMEFYVPLTQNIDVDAERSRLSKELEYNVGFLKSVQVKLSNEKFVANAKPELIANEKKKQADAEAKIKAIEEQLSNLN
jgi:valyl-tRNA synthetase